MSTDEYVPSEGEVRSAYVSRYLTNQLRQGAEFDRFLARLRRDAAREALDGLIADKAHTTVLLRAENGGNVEDVLTHYRDTHYPEESP